MTEGTRILKVTFNLAVNWNMAHHCLQLAAVDWDKRSFKTVFQPVSGRLLEK